MKGQPGIRAQHGSARRFAVWSALLAVLLSCAVPLLPAVDVAGLYEAEVPVDGQGTKERSRALEEALAQVLVKITGDREAPVRPETQALMARPARFVQQYRYRTVPGAPDESAAAPEMRRVLWVRFDAAALERALAGLGVPVWGGERPATLIWLAVDAGGDRFLAGADAPAALRASLEAAARRRGLPLLYPLLDLKDRSRIGFADVWGGFLENVWEASQRYHAAVVLVGRIRRDAAGEWTGRWSLLMQERDERHWEVSGVPFDEVLAAGIDRTADVLGARYAMLPGTEERNAVMVVVEGVSGLEAYARTARYLASLRAVRAVQVREVGPEHVEFLLEIRGARRKLAEAIALGDTLVPVMQPGGTPSRGGRTTLKYRLVP